MRSLVMVSFDIREADTRTRARVNRLVFGHSTTKVVGGMAKVYAYRGLVDEPGTLRIGQSVVALPPHLVPKLAGALARWGVRHRTWRILV